MPRLFSAIKIPKNISETLATKQMGIANARYVNPNDFHITLGFFGDVSNEVAFEINQALSATANQEPFNIKLTGFDIFGTKKPHSLIIKIKKTTPLLELRELQNQKMQSLGIKSDAKKFSPHITLARLNKSKAKDIANYLTYNYFENSLEFKAKGFSLFSVRDSIGGGPYIEEQIYQFNPFISHSSC